MLAGLLRWPVAGVWLAAGWLLAWLLAGCLLGRWTGLLVQCELVLNPIRKQEILQMSTKIRERQCSMSPIRTQFESSCKGSSVVDNKEIHISSSVRAGANPDRNRNICKLVHKRAGANAWCCHFEPNPFTCWKYQQICKFRTQCEPVLSPVRKREMLRISTLCAATSDPIRKQLETVKCWK